MSTRTEELEHDTNEDANLDNPGVATPIRVAVRQPDEKEEQRREKRREGGWDETKPWLDPENPAIWTGDIGDD